MLSRSEILTRLLRPGIIAVVRTPDPYQVLPIARALEAGGVTAIEITLTVPNATDAIRECCRTLGTTCVVGAGTVLNASTCCASIEAGAQFIVSPITRADIVDAAHAANKPVMLGAYTPTEAQTAHELGADLIKLFPADQLGPAHVKALRAPLPHLKIIPTGGVDLHTAAEFLKAGCVALGVGSSLLTRDILAQSNWPELTRLAAAYVEIANQHHATRPGQ